MLKSTLTIFMIVLGVCAWAIVVPQSPAPNTINPRYSAVRTNFMNNSVINVSRTLIASSKTVSCLTAFLRNFMNGNPTGLSVLLVGTKPGVARVFLSKIEEERAIFLLSGNLDNRIYQKTMSEALIIVSSHKTLQNSTINILNLCGKGCWYALILTDVFDDSAKFETEARQVVSVMWKKKLAHIVVLGTVGTNLYAVKSKSFKTGVLREPRKPVRLDQCQGDEGWTSKNMFTRLALSNSIINIGFFAKMPYVTMTSDEQGNEYYMGLEVWIMLIASEVLHFDPVAHEIEWSNDTTVEDEVIEEFESDREVDIVIGGVLWDPEGIVDFTMPYDVAQVVWVMPKFNNVSLQGLVSPLGHLVWLAVAGVLLFGVFLRFTLFRSTSFLEIFALILSVAWYKQPSKHSVRLYVMSWVLFGFLLAQFYLASMAGQLMAHADMQINTMAELVDMGLILGGTKTHKMMFDAADTHVDDSDVINAISKRFITFTEDEYEKQWNDLISGANQSVALVLTMNSSALGRSYSQQYAHTLSEVLASYPLAFAVWRGLPYLSQLDRVIQRLVQGGIVNFLGRRSTSGDAHFDDEDSGNLDLDDLAPAFLILLMGYLASVLCFLGEFVVASLKNRKKKNKIQKKVGNRKKRRTIRKNGKKIVVVQTVKPNVKFTRYSQMHKASLFKDF